MHTGLSWVDTVLDAAPAARRKLKEAVIEGIKLFNANWRKKNEEFELVGTSPEARALYKTITSGEVEFIGFAPNIHYIKESGKDDELSAIWQHAFGVPALLFKHKKLPMLLIVGPEIRFNRSVLTEIDANKHLGLTYEGIRGITG